MKAFGDIGVLKKYKDKKEEAVRQKRKKEYLEDMKEGINHMVQPMVDELKANNVEQNKKLEELLRSSNDLLRKEITRIYYKYLPY